MSSSSSLPLSFFSSSSWKLVSATLNDDRNGVAIANGSKNLIVVGGIRRVPDPSWVSSACESFCVETETWERLPSMPVGHYASVAVWNNDNNTLFVLGGCSQRRNCLESVECLRQNVWQSLPSMSTRRVDFTAALVNHKLVVVGGSNERYRELQTAESFDPKTQSWTMLPDMLEPRKCHAMAVVHPNMLCVFGGYNRVSKRLRSAECYREGKWESLPDMPSARERGTAVAVGQYVLLMGGGDGVRPLQRVDCFDTQSCQWLAPGPSLHKIRMGGSAVLVGQNTIYVLGGTGMNGHGIREMEKMDIHPHYTILPRLQPLLEQDQELLLGIWPHVLASCSHIPSVLYSILCSDKVKTESVLLLHNKIQ